MPQTIAVIGLGYVGLPLAIALLEKDFRVIGVDKDQSKISQLEKGESYFNHLAAEKTQYAINTRRFLVTTDVQHVANANAIIICVPTPLDEDRQPDLSYVENAARDIAPFLKPGQLVSLESTTYPGTTRDLVRPILESKSQLKAGVNFSLVYAPEREDPGNCQFSTSDIPRVLGGLTPNCLQEGVKLYSQFVSRVLPMRSLESAELTKLTENIFRCVNIALVNELKMLVHRICEKDGSDMDIFEIIDAAATKPFGFMPFYPGPGLGGHCIPVDPFYLSWRAKRLDFHTHFIDLAGEINTHMPYYVVERVRNALSRQHKVLENSTILVLGAAYKSDVGDVRESPAIRILELLTERDAKVLYHDPYVPELFLPHHNKTLASSELSEELIRSADAVAVVTAHRGVDYHAVAAHAHVVVDARGIMRSTSIDPNKLYLA